MPRLPVSSHLPLEKGSPENMGSLPDPFEDYCVYKEAEKLFRQGILANPLIQRELPLEIHDCSKNIKFEGSDKPTIAVNWRFAESVSALKGYEAAVLAVLLKRKYGITAPEITINTYVREWCPIVRVQVCGFC